MTKLTPRLQTVADLIEKCDCFLDIGTDHAYLPAYIIEKGIAKKAIASDINPNPLKNAKKTLEEEGLEEKIALRLSAGFENIKENEAQEIAIAGMGGMMIAEMIANTPWLKNKKIHLVLQPMTHFECVRRELYNNGFEVDAELTVSEGERVYLVLSARYCGEVSEKAPHWLYLGNLLKSENETDKKLVKKVLKMLYKKYEFEKDGEISEIIRSVENAESN